MTSNLEFLQVIVAVEPLTSILTSSPFTLERISLNFLAGRVKLPSSSIVALISVTIVKSKSVAVNLI